MEAIFTGFWIALLNKKDLEKISFTYYDNAKSFKDDDYSCLEYNQMGLFNWEISAIEDYFSKPPSSIVIAGSGGGREALYLVKKGYEIKGWECLEKLVDSAKRLFKSEKLISPIHYSAPDDCPNENKKYSCAIIGWGAYMLIKGRHR